MKPKKQQKSSFDKLRKNIMRFQQQMEKPPLKISIDFFVCLSFQIFLGPKNERIFQWKFGILENCTIEVQENWRENPRNFPLYRSVSLKIRNNRYLRCSNHFTISIVLSKSSTIQVSLKDGESFSICWDFFSWENWGF